MKIFQQGDKDDIAANSLFSWSTSPRIVVVSGLQSVIIGIFVFAVYASIFSSFPFQSLSPASYAEGMTNSLWIVLVFSLSLGIATSVTYWFLINIGLGTQKANNTLPRVFFTLLFIAILLLAILAFLRTIITAIGLLAALLFVLIGPLALLGGLLTRSRVAIYSGLLLIGFMVIVIVTFGAVDNQPITTAANLFGLLTLAATTFLSTPWFGNLAFKQRFGIDDFEELKAEVHQLDSVIQNINIISSAEHGDTVPNEFWADVARERASSATHGFTVPYQHAALPWNRPSEDTYVPPPHPREVARAIEYYQNLRSLVELFSQIPDPTPVTRRCGEIASKSLPKQNAAISQTQLQITDDLNEILSAYRTVRDHRAETIIESLETKLNQVNTNNLTDTRSDDLPPTAVSDLDEIAAWLSEETHHLNQQQRLEELRAEWPETAGDIFNLELTTFETLTADMTDVDRDRLESDLDAAEDIHRLAVDVDRLCTAYDEQMLSQLPAAYGKFLSQSATPSRADLLDDTLGIIEKALKAHEQWAEPFADVVDTLTEKIENGAIERADLEDAETLLADSQAILKFLDTHSTNHPSIDADGWRESVRAGLTHFSPPIVRSTAKQVERIGDALWEQGDLYEFSWQEFEELVADALETEGYETRVTQASNDEGVDIWMSRDDLRVAVQVKQFQRGNNVGRPTLQKISSTIAKGDADKAIVVTSSDFASTARTYAADFGTTLRLINGIELVQLLSESDIPPPVTDSESSDNWWE